MDFLCQDQSSLTSKDAMTLMSEEDLIKQAYEEFIKNLFRNFYDAYTTSNSSTQEKAAEQVFQNAVKAARKARDRALAILPK
jgi:S-methylmethionine-dependent homocysteine/selenocysteine methylase